ncbi:MAG TPA: endonuclease/exonuclease/phosphatase family protein [Verrucomicrobiae bacterium]|nr:endonuclease/exonuclease/phosphatase family protein [Verrucomicrobiae bacterium]
MKAIVSSFASGARAFAPGLLFSAIAGCLLTGCITGAPSRVQIQHPAAQQSVGQPFDDSTSLRVTTFNVWGLPSWLNGAPSARFGEISRQLSVLGSDVVLLQEVWTRRCFSELSAAGGTTNRCWWAAAARHKGTMLGQNGLLTLSKFPIQSAEVKYFSRAQLPDALMHKGALKVTISVGEGRLINIWNVHMQDGSSPAVRSSQLAELIAWVEHAGDGQIADIVGGDFNFTPGSDEFKRFARAIGPDVHQLANDDPFPTWDGLNSHLGETLDHIFVRVRQSGEEIGARPRRVFEAARPSQRLSDHMGMEALLTFHQREDQPLSVLVGQSGQSDEEEWPF